MRARVRERTHLIVYTNVLCTIQALLCFVLCEIFNEGMILLHVRIGVFVFYACMILVTRVHTFTLS